MILFNSKYSKQRSKLRKVIKKNPQSYYNIITQNIYKADKTTQNYIINEFIPFKLWLEELNLYNYFLQEIINTKKTFQDIFQFIEDALYAKTHQFTEYKNNLSNDIKVLKNTSILCKKTKIMTKYSYEKVLKISKFISEYKLYNIDLKTINNNLNMKTKEEIVKILNQKNEIVKALGYSKRSQTRMHHNRITVIFPDKKVKVFEGTKTLADYLGCSCDLINRCIRLNRASKKLKNLTIITNKNCTEIRETSIGRPKGLKDAKKRKEGSGASLCKAVTLREISTNKEIHFNSITECVKFLKVCYLSFNRWYKGNYVKSKKLKDYVIISVEKSDKNRSKCSRYNSVKAMNLAHSRKIVIENIETHERMIYNTFAEFKATYKINIITFKAFEKSEKTPKRLKGWKYIPSK